MLDSWFAARHRARMSWNKGFRGRSSLGIVGAALLAGLSYTSPAAAQYVYLNETTAPNDLLSHQWLGSSVLFPAPTLTDPLGFPTQGRYTVGDLDGDGNPEVIFTFPILAGEGRLLVYTFDRVAGTYGPQRELLFAADADGRIFTGDVDGDGNDEVLLATFDNATPAPRPPTGTGHIYVVDVQSLNPPVFKTYDIPNQFITRHAQFAAADVTGDRRAEILSLTQDATGATAFNEPTGPATLFACSPVLGSPSSCTPVGSVTIPPGPSNRYPTSLDAANFDGAGTRAIVGYGTACEPTDPAQVLLVNVQAGTTEGPLTLASPFQHLAAGTLDKNEVPELVTTAGGQPGLTGALQIFHFDTATRTFSLTAAAAAGLPLNDCLPPPPPPGTAVTSEPPAKPALAVQRIGDICNGLDDDGDGDVDENCMLRFLFVPICFQGTDDEFKAATQAHVDFFAHSLGLDACPSTIRVEWVPQATFEIAPDCNPNYFIGNFTFDLEQGLKTLGIDRTQYSSIIAFTNQETFPANDTSRVAGLTFPGADNFNYVQHLPNVITNSVTGHMFNIIPAHVFSHEFGHLAGFDEEYRNNPNALNPIEARLGCNPSDTSCCVDPPNCTFYEGNVPPGGGRCIMSYVDAGTSVVPAPAANRGWCEDCLHHWRQLSPVRVPLTAPVDCGSAYDGIGPLLNVGGRMNASGGMKDVTFAAGRGRMPMSIPSIGAFSLRIEDGAGAAFYEARFDARGMATTTANLPPKTFAEVPIELRAPLPPTVNPAHPLPLVIAKNGVDVSRTTLNGSPPTANAGPDQTLECASPSGTTLSLDGRASSDPDGDTLAFTWSSTGVTITQPSAAVTAASAPRGMFGVTLTVSDGINSASDALTVTVRDTTKPVFAAPGAQAFATCAGSVRVVPTPPAASDACDPAPVVKGVVTKSNGTTVNVPLDAAGGATLAPGTHTVTWTATDASANKATTTQQITVQPGLFANGAIEVADRAQVVSSSGFAQLSNAGTGLSQLGVSAHTGSLATFGSVKLRSSATVHGSLVAKGSISLDPGATVTGTKQQFTTPVLPPFPGLSVTFPPSSGDVPIAKNETRALAPGSYGLVSMLQGSTLNLAAGKYYFDRLWISETTSRVNVAPTSEIYVKTQLIFRGSFGAPANVGYLGTQITILEAPFQGLVRSPNARVIARKNYTGSIVAHDIEASPDVVVMCSATPLGAPSLPGAAFELKAAAAVAASGASGGEASSDAGAPAAGCSIAPAPSGSSPLAAFAVLSALALFVSRRRARKTRNRTWPWQRGQSAPEERSRSAYGERAFAECSLSKARIPLGG